MAPKLNEINTRYHTFVENQVLTSEQLNEFISYFDDQDRLSRVFLTGVGIICGFDLEAESGKITITPGVGITTDGDLIQLKTETKKTKKLQLEYNPVEYKHFKKFSDDIAKYPPFKKPAPGFEIKKETVMDLWEIFPNPVENSTPLGAFLNLDKMAVLLYLESYAKEGDLCTAIDCDNQGVEQVAKLRVLLVSADDVKIIAKNDLLYTKYNLWAKTNALPRVAVKRVVLNAVNTAGYASLKQAFDKAVADGTLLDGLTKGIESLALDFNQLLQLNFSVSAAQTIQNLKTVVQTEYPVGFQYKYDWLKDVVDTYNEIIELLLDLKEECLPDITAFPKHLMLGLISEIQNKNKQLRHQYYKSKAHSSGDYKFLHCKNLVLRLFNIINHFEVFTGEIKITPSNILNELSNRAIPFYYAENSELLSVWDYSKTQKNNEDKNLWYHTSLLSGKPQIQKPLEYNIDQNDFFRIEGHQGQDYRDVLEKIEDLKRENGLAFQVKALSLSLNKQDIDFDDYECEFQDLKVMLDAWQKEQDCILAEISNFFSSFSTKEPGVNVKEKELGISKLRESHLVTDTGFLRTPGTAPGGDKAVESVLKESIQPEYTGKATYFISNPVSDNLNTSKDTLGEALVNAYQETKGGSVNDIIAVSNQKLADKFSSAAWAEQPEIRELIAEDTVKLLAHSHYITQVRPESLAGITGSKVDNYKLSLEELCKQVKVFKTKYESVALNAALKSIIGIFINQLSSVCCAGKKLEILMAEIEERVKNILLRLTLSEFIKKHPGLEHKAGVEPGGTFILVYFNETQVRGNVVQSIKTVEDKVFSTMDAMRSAEKKSVKPENPVFRIASVGVGESRVEIIKESDWKAILGESVRRPLIPTNTVVADFSLPYLCCSNCSTIEYVILKPPASLRLDKDRFCLGKDSQPISLDISPADGIVKTNPATEALKIEGNKLTISEEEFPADMFGQPIRFTVNDQVTDALLIVYKAIQVDFEWKTAPGAENVYTFIPSGDLDGASFYWEFGDGQISDERNPTHKYELPVNDENKIIVKLTVTAPNGVCQNTVEHIIHFEIKTKITLKKTEFCSNDEKLYPFGVIPVGASVEIEGNGVVKSLAGYDFSPAQAEPGNISFKVNGELADITATVYPAPLAKFTWEQKQNILVFTNLSENAFKFLWNINGESVERNDSTPVLIPLKPDSPVVWEVALQAFGADVCVASIHKENISVNLEKPTINLVRDEYCENDEKFYPFTVTPATAEVEIAGKGVVKTADGFEFNPLEAGVGEITFRLNGELTDLSVVVQPAPIARFTADQEGNTLVLTNSSENASDFAWTINQEKIETVGTTPVVKELTPDSPTTWKIRLEARGAAVCGVNRTAWITVNTDFVNPTRVDNCLEETKAAIATDSRTLAKLNLANNDLVVPVWNATSELYGGTARFGDGVINHIDAWLSGENNGKLRPLFMELMQETANRILEIDPARQKTEYTRLVAIFELQLKLFYNILACQDKHRLEESRDEIQEILNQIAKMLLALNRKKVTFSSSLRTFMQMFAEKVKDVDYLNDHLTLIKTRRLI